MQWRYLFWVGAGCLALGLLGRSCLCRHDPDRLLQRVMLGGPVEVARFWADHGIESQLSLTNADEQIGAEVVSGVGTAGQEPVVILRLHDSHDWDWQYLVFTWRMGIWRFAGHLDFPDQKYEPPSSRYVEVAPGQRCLAIRQLSCSGTGCLLYEDVWHRLERGRVVEVLRYPVDGHVVGWGLPWDRIFAVTATYGTHEVSGSFRLRLAVREDFYPPDSDLEPPSHHSKAGSLILDWNREQGRFELDSRHSDMTWEQLRDVWEGNPTGEAASGG